MNEIIIKVVDRRSKRPNLRNFLFRCGRGQLGLSELTQKYLLRSFSYCFKKLKDYPATLKLKKIKKRLTFKDNLEIEAIKVRHGSIESLS